MKKTVVLYPGLFATHFVPMMQLADALEDEDYAVAVALIDVTLDHDAALAAAVARAASSRPSVAFHRLPRVDDPPAITNDAQMIVRYFETIQRYNAPLCEFLRSLLVPRGGSLHAVVMDGPSVEAVDVARELGVPVFSFFATNASSVAVFLQLPWIQAQPSFRELGDELLDIRGVPPLPASNLMAEYLEDPESEVYRAMMRVTRRNAETDGILVNTFPSLEPRALAALRDDPLLTLAAAAGGGGGGERLRTPPVYCVGPLVPTGPSETQENNDTNKHECLAWLDEQPERSVVFLSFGMLGQLCHTAEQLREIALGLEKSGHRFLWVVRAPTGNGTETERAFGLHDDPDLDALLPAGFAERTRGRGVVVNLWAPQLEVLRHRATGVFVTHCGWNSAMEAITGGVPMICWPLYAEQKMNKVFMVEEMGVGVEVDGWQRGLVRAEEVEAKVRLVMESKEGEKLRARVMEHKDAAAVAWKDGGSSRADFRQFLFDAGNLGPEQSPT